MMLKTELDLLIPFHDVDSMGVVWHGHYIKYLELVRCKLLDKIDYGYIRMKESGFAWPVVDARVKYIKPLFFDQKVTVEAYVSEWEYRLLLKYRILDQDGSVVTKAHTTQIAVDMESKQMCYESPEILVQRLKDKELI